MCLTLDRVVCIKKSWPDRILGKMLYTFDAFLHPGVKMGTGRGGSRRGIGWLATCLFSVKQKIETWNKVVNIMTETKVNFLEKYLIVIST